MSAASPAPSTTTSTGGRTVVVGHGMAAVALVERLVARGVGDVTVVGDERHAPYNRILLSAVLAGTHRREALGMSPFASAMKRSVYSINTCKC